MADESNLSSKEKRIILWSVFIISASLLSFEIVLTRILSVMISYHYVFAVVSLALLGMGLGGVYVHLLPGRDIPVNWRTARLAVYAGLASLSMALTPLSIVSVGHIEALRGNVLLYCLVPFCSFFFGGAFISQLFLEYSKISSWIYGADLIGAALGCALIILILSMMNQLNAVYLMALMSSLPAMLLFRGVSKTSRHRG